MLLLRTEEMAAIDSSEHLTVKTSPNAVIQCQPL